MKHAVILLAITALAACGKRAADARWLEHYGFDPHDQPNLATGLSR